MHLFAFRFALILLASTGWIGVQSIFAQRVAAGTRHSLFICPDGKVWASGKNTFGQLGNGTLLPSIIPKQVAILSGAVAVAAGEDHSLALKSDGTVWAWGQDSIGQLGNGSTRRDDSIPMLLPDLFDIVAVATRNYHSLALKSDGTVWAWGLNNLGQLGDSTYLSRPAPVPVLRLSGIIAIGTGNGHSIALKNDGTVWSWGNGGNGQRGDGNTNTSDNIPDSISWLANITKIAVGGDHALALRNDGILFAWGLNLQGQLGNGDSLESSTPIQILNNSNIDTIAAGWNHSFATLTNGNVYAWGEGLDGELGNGGVGIPVPTHVAALDGIKTLSGGFWHSIGLQTNDTISVWGANTSGQLGDNSITNKLTPVDLIGLCPQYVDLRDTTFTNYFRPSSSGPADWVAGELNSSIDLPGGKTMYLFGQSHIGSITGNLIPCNSPTVVHNCIVLQDSAVPNMLTTVLDTNSLIADYSYFCDSLNPTNHFEPGHGYLRDDTAYVFLSRWRSDSIFLGNYIARLRKGITTWTLEDINRMIDGDSSIDFGGAVLVEGIHVYAYGAKDSAQIHLPYVARREFADTSAAWEYYAPSGWSTAIADARSISRYNVAERYSVTKLLGNHYYLISHDQAPDTSTCNARRNIMVYRSSSLAGPFSDPVLLYVAEDQIAGEYLQTFDAYAHVQSAGCDSLRISYNVHDVGRAACPSQCQGGTTQIADTWRPKFIRVRFDGIDTMLQLLPPPTPSGAVLNISGDTVTFTNNSLNASSYLWYFGDGTTSDSTNPVHIYTASGNYVAMLVAIGCNGERDTFPVPVGPILVQAETAILPIPSLTIFPNPSAGTFRLRAQDIGSEPISIEIYSTLGVPVHTQTALPVGGRLDLQLDLAPGEAHLPTGLYHLRMRNRSYFATRTLSIVTDQ